MSAISTHFGEGGANLVAGGGAGHPSLPTVLRDIADDLAAVRGAAIASPALATFTNPPTVGEMAALQALVNEMRAAMNTTSAATLLTTKV